MIYTIETVQVKRGFVGIVRNQAGAIVKQTVVVELESHAYRGAKAIKAGLTGAWR
jgi:hypothetical protein